ncbi:MAG: choice-of-anchor X domain-containing protein [Lysobacterales bacterium]
MQVRLVVAAIGCCLGMSSIDSHAQALDAKQLAGPPSEFAAMRPLNPADAAIHSKAALLPIEMVADKAGGWGAEVALPVESDSVRFLVFGGNDIGWDAQLRSPGGRIEKAARAVAGDNRMSEFGLNEAKFPADYYALQGIESGTWNLKLSSSNAQARRGFVLIEGQADTQLVSYQTHTRQLVGERIGLIASLYAQTEQGELLYAKAGGQIASASLRVTAPNGEVQLLAMYDDGKHADGAAGDGIFGGDFLADKAGNYQAQVTVRGSNRYGRPLVRSAEHLLPIVEPTLQLAGTKASASNSVNAGRLDLKVPVAGEKAGRHYRGYAEVWGSDKNGAAVPVAWVSGMVEPKQGAVSFGLDTRWIALAGAQAPFELRNLRVEDSDVFVNLAGAERLPMSVPSFSAKTSAGAIVIDEAMTQGLRPRALKADKGTGSRLLLVHGYCSGGVWPASQFTNASTFLDANQNRSHDQFAQLIKNYGATWNSFGVVAHSQGGPASLHLYTYYWSGLDNATGSRLIQSVGSPYQGTNIAGILATMGNWFGVACGSNANLTYSGASSWLAGIPTSSRAKVNYYTTSFKLTNWYTNDYCQIATDLVLSDPEDGTTEQAKGQLSGAVNRGHVTGQCHTAGMRDPAQYLNASRNSTMNSNAAR